MINSIDQLKLSLLDHTEAERLDRHTYLELAFATEVHKSKKLEAALKQAEKVNAGLRYDLKKLVEDNDNIEFSNMLVNNEIEYTKRSNSAFDFTVHLFSKIKDSVGNEWEYVHKGGEELTKEDFSAIVDEIERIKLKGASCKNLR